MSDDEIRDLVHKISMRVEYLGNRSIDFLRLTAGYNCNSPHEARQKNAGLSRGELLSIIIQEEFMPNS